MQVRFFLHDDLITELISFLYEMTAQELREDLQFYLEWRNHVPSMFLSCQLLDTQFWYHRANPMCRYHPFHPRKFLNMRPEEVWAPTMIALGNMICKERIRGAKTYKKCALRWIFDCVENVEIWYWWHVKQLLFSRLSAEHFVERAPSRFVREALEQIADGTPFSSFLEV